MKKLLLMAFLIGSFSHYLSAQDTVYLKKEAKKKVITDREPQAIYAEVGGAGVYFSANYDRRFKKQTDGLGWHAGLGYSFDNYFRFTTLPVGINFLAGNKVKGRFFEVGFNETLLFAGSSNYTSYSIIDDVYIEPNTTTLITTLNVGYRSQPTKGGVNFRTGLSPYLITGNTGINFYLSFGYNF